LSDLDGHGFYWLQFYCAHVKSGKVKGKVSPTFASSRPSRADARGSFAHPAIAAGFASLVPAVKSFGIAATTLRRSASRLNTSLLRRQEPISTQ
jgi:(2R)-3-sulfolactate dehydrogenase (NADP+)